MPSQSVVSSRGVTVVGVNFICCSFRAGEWWWTEYPLHLAFRAREGNLCCCGGSRCCHVGRAVSHVSSEEGMAGWRKIYPPRSSILSEGGTRCRRPH